MPYNTSKRYFYLHKTPVILVTFSLYFIQSVSIGKPWHYGSPMSMHVLATKYSPKYLFIPITTNFSIFDHNLDMYFLNSLYFSQKSDESSKYVAEHIWHILYKNAKCVLKNGEEFKNNKSDKGCLTVQSVFRIHIKCNFLLIKIAW